MAAHHAEDAATIGTLVCVRLRPPSSKERGVRCLTRTGEGEVTYQGAPDSVPASTFAYDLVFGEDVSQAQVFDRCKHVVTCVLAGQNGTILAYGQTGSGKTHTLIGVVDGPDSTELQGIVPRAVRALGEGIASETTSGVEWEVRLSVVEVYCERIRDLLEPPGSYRDDNLPVKHDPERGMFVEGATEVSVANEEQLVAVMQAGLGARAVSATRMNEASSRSHCIVAVTVVKTCEDGSTLRGKLCMVDLAGSERQDKTFALGQTALEGSQINKSLSALANVIYALTDSSSSSSSGGGSGGNSGGVPTKHVPYRDSKLTRVLQDSLGGNARTALIICCSPCADNAPESLSSLRFGSRARGMTSRPAINAKGPSADKLALQLAAAKAQVAALQGELAALKLQAGGGGAKGCAAGKEGSRGHGTDAVGHPGVGSVAEGAGGGAGFDDDDGVSGGKDGGSGVGESSAAWRKGRWVAWALHALSVVSVLGYMALEDHWRRAAVANGAYAD